VTLADIKGDERFADLALIRQSRLSSMQAFHPSDLNEPLAQVWSYCVDRRSSKPHARDRTNRRHMSACDGV
jgi:hypothetical protein